MSETRTVLVIGDPILDRHIVGKARRISPEAPIPVVEQQTVTDSLGGAANVAANLVTLGAPSVYLAGMTGRDYAATALEQMLNEAGIGSFLAHNERMRTVTKTRVSADGQQIVRIDDECTRHDEWHTQALIAGLGRMLQPGSDLGLVVVADYNKGTFTPDVIRYVIDACAALQIPLFVDAKPAKIRDWRQATLLKVNRGEAIAIAMEDGCIHPGLLTDAAPEVAVEHLRQTYGFSTVAVTCGPAGVVYWDGSRVGRMPTQAQHVYDVTGAGDVFMAAMAKGGLDGMTFEESLFRANVAAGLAVKEYGTVTVQRDDLEDAILARRGWAGKIMGHDAAVAFAKRKREAGRSIVLANGCFDALHPGHIYLLSQARAEGDLLIVAHNDDASIARLKGPGRPIIPEPLRASQLAMLDIVDCVMTFDGEVEPLVRALHPHVLVKGGQYVGTKVPGADYVAGYGGRLALVQMLTGASTTEINLRKQG